jgi:hypothetical protein
MLRRLFYTRPYSRYGDKRFGLVATGPEAAIQPDLRLALAQAALSLATIHVIQHAAAVLALPQRALKVRPARSCRRLRNAGPISAPGVQMPPSPCTSRTRQRALSAIILLVEP